MGVTSSVVYATVGDVAPVWFAAAASVFLANESVIIALLSVTLGVVGTVPTIALVWSNTAITDWVTKSSPEGAVFSGPVWITDTGSVDEASIFNADFTVSVVRSMTAITAMFTFTGVFVTAVTCPVVVTGTVSIVVTVRVHGTFGTEFFSWSVAAEFLLTVAVTWSDVDAAAFAFPVFVTDAISVVVEGGVVNACVTVTGTWSPAAVTFVVTPSLVDRAIVSCPPVVTLTVVFTGVCVNNYVSVMYTVLTVTAIWTSTSVTDWVTWSHVVDTAFVDPVIVTDASSVIEWVVVCVFNTLNTVTGFITVTGVTSVVAGSSPCATVIT